ncbi:N-acetylmuramoyl-L-alanine amidase [Castellaniella sp.]|uniref:N-acetylmuramoyl-L-alanine amidase family protein n=1 Tax=Castellaniella sp. TaxID=1955812 RepID=UPI002AFF46BC|nr:N-acetylmuramoyl-L-alanine amidase [Castellaniella sp.]
MRIKNQLAAVCLLLSGCSTVPVVVDSPPQALQAEAPLIVLDPGHSPTSGGATSVRGTPEVTYNDRFVAELAPALRAAGWRVWVTRQPDQTLGLVDRPKIANDLKADIFLSVHHDSIQLRCLKPVVVSGRTVYQTRQPTGGYSLYVSKKNPKFSRSYDLAKVLGGQLHALGRAPMLEHAGKACGESRPLLDSRLGIYQYDNLAVLRHSKIPAVLLEIGVITDVQDEAYVNVADHRQQMISGIVRGLQRYSELILQSGDE